MEAERDMHYRYFFLSFAAAFFLLSLLFLFLMITVHPKTPDILASAPDTDEEAFVYTPSPSDALSVLFIGTENGSAGAGTFILARFDPAQGTVPIAVLPPQTVVQNAGRSETLSAVYRYGGADYVRAALADTLGITIDRYVRVSTDAFVACANLIGNVEFELSEELIIDSSGIPLTLSQGRQLLDGGRVLSMITHRSYEGGELARCRMIGELTAAIVNQRIDVVESTLVDKVFEGIVNLIDTDISYVDYADRKDAAQFLCQLGADPALPLELAGELDNGEGAFVLSDTAVAQLRQHFP